MESVKIGLITDTHSNLPALKAMLTEFKRQNCTEIIHTGDAIAMGAFPKECLDLLYATENLTLLMGNHELLYLVGIDNLQKPMAEDEARHHKQIHKMIGPDYYDKIKSWPFTLEKNLFGHKIVFCHYAMHDGKFYRPIVNPTVEQLDEIFDYMDAEIIFFGHEHHPLTVQGKKLYVDIGSLGCNHENFAKGTILSADETGIKIKDVKVPYDKQILFDAMEQRKIERGEFIAREFFGKK